MSEIAGRLAAQAGAYFLEKPLGGRGLLLGGVPGVAPGKVVVIGGGIVGYNAAVIALGLGANVTILERSIDRMRHLEEMLAGRVTLLDVVEPPDRGVGRGRGRRHRRGADPRRARAEARHARDGRAAMKRGLGPRRRRDRPGRLRRDLAADDALGPGLRRRRRHPLLRREHARRGADHLDEGADERDAAVRRGDRRPRAAPRRSRATLRSRAASTSSTARSRTRRSPRRTASSTRRSRTSSRCRRSEPATKLWGSGWLLRSCVREELDDEPGHAGRERDDARR